MIASQDSAMAEACVCPPRTGPAPDTLADIIRRFCEPCLRGPAAAAELERRERLRGAHWAEETGL